MHTALPRLAIIAIGCAAIAASAVVARGDWPYAQPLVPLAILWLTLVGWGFRSLLGRHLRFHDRLAYSEAQLAMERHARMQTEKSLGDAHTSLCRLVQQQEQVRESERNRIARDIHDDLGQHMLALKIELSLLQVSTSGAHPLVHQKVGALLNSLDQAIASLRTVIKDLRPIALEHGLQNAMQAHLSEFTRLNGIRHELEAAPEAFQPGPDRGVDAMLFRILQESLANVARHAQATEVKIALVRNGDLLTMNVRDNGIGMDSQPGAGGCGLVGIADRVNAAGGKFLIDSKPGGGTLLSLSIPVLRPANAQ
ncbi:MAG: sensor histidine kinase [Pseudomonadota bacterium]|nr:sensor histidine kinase [Pseudomonadota bacterium]